MSSCHHQEQGELLGPTSELPRSESTRRGFFFFFSYILTLVEPIQTPGFLYVVVVLRFIYLAASGLSCRTQNLHCFMWDLSLVGGSGRLLFIVVEAFSWLLFSWLLFIVVEAFSWLLLWSTDSRVHGLQYCGSWALECRSVAVVCGHSCPMACGIFETRNGTPVSCNGRWILIHWTTRKVLCLCFRLGVDKLACGLYPVCCLFL